MFGYLRADTGIIWALGIYCRRECVPYALIVVKTVSSFVETGGEERSYWLKKFIDAAAAGACAAGSSGSGWRGEGCFCHLKEKQPIKTNTPAPGL